MKEKLALAMDLPLEDGLQLYPRVAAYVGYAKVGLSLFVEHGPRAVEAFRSLGARVFLDLKLHDIPNTVELAAARAAALGVTLLTVHAQGGAAMIRAALSGAANGAAKAGEAPPLILAVTVLTSLGEPDLKELGEDRTPAQVAHRLASAALSAGATGLVCSAQEAGALRRLHGPGVFLCTPGIRPASAAVGDQARAETPRAAVEAGSDLLVIGRPIIAAQDPVAAAASIAEQMRG